MGCHAYVIAGDSGAVKVGIAANIENRLRDLQAASPLTLRVEYLAHVSGRQPARRVEARAHRILNGYRVHGEWFTASVRMAVDAVIVAAFELGIQLEHVVDPRSLPTSPRRDVLQHEAWARFLRSRRYARQRASAALR